tara:strand:+ start:6503 stop:7393 length:891 start_codon:yes stop_codon:yes gene_type:complete
MTNLYTHRGKNIAKTWALMVGFLIFVIAFGWVMAEAYGNPIILYFAISIALIMNVISYWRSDKIALALVSARPASREEHFHLYTTVENLAITAGLPKPKVYIINDSAPNAFATGRDPEHGVVAVTTGLLSILDKGELEGVLAHELSHIGNRDILVGTVAVVLVGFIVMLSDFFLRSTFWGVGGRDKGSRANAIMLVIGIAAAILAPLAASLMQLAISRKREFLADASGALLTRYPKGLASALQKISMHGAPMKKANDATAHLFIANPFGNKVKKKFLTRIFMTHPPVEERIRALVG